MKPVYRAAIVGCGRIASLFAADKKRKGIITHAQAYLNQPRTRLVAACDLNEQRLHAFGRAWDVDALYTDLDRMLEKEKIDFLSICTWSDSHLKVLAPALKKPLKGILCEKPLASNLKDARKMITLCRRKRIPLLVNHTRRYLGLYRQIKKMIDSGELGKIQSVSCYYTAGLLNTGTHLFDTLRFFFGDVRWVWADPDYSVGEGDKSLSGYLSFKKGFGCQLSALDVKNYLIFEVDIYGTRKRVRLTDSGLRAHFWNVKPSRQFSGYQTLEPGRILEADLSEGFPNLVKNLIASAEDSEKPHCSGEDGQACLEISLAMEKSFKQKGKKIPLPLESEP